MEVVLQKVLGHILPSRAAFARGSQGAKILQGGIGSLAIKLCYAGLQFAVGVSLARLLGPEALGVYAFVIAVIHLLAVAAQAGFPTYLVRGVSVARARNELPTARDLIMAGAALVTMLSVAIAIGLGAWIVLTGPLLAGIPDSAFLLGLVLIPLLSLSTTIAAGLRGLGAVVAGQVPDEIVRPLAFVILLMGALLWKGALTPEHALLLHGLSAFAAVIAAAAYLARTIPRTTEPFALSWRHSTLFQITFPFLLLAGAQVLNHNVDIVMLSALTTSHDVGYYRVGVQVVDGLTLPLYAVSMTIAPHIARLHAQQDWRRLQRLLVYSHRMGAAIILPLAVLLSLFARPFIALTFGPEYVSAAQVLIIFAISKTAYATVGLSGLALSMFGMPTAAFAVTAATVITNVLLNLLLIPAFGIGGAAIATGISQFAVAAGSVAYLHSRKNLGISLFHSTRLV